MSGKSNRITFPVPYQNVIQAKFTMTNVTGATSDAYYRFFDSKGVRVGTANTHPSNMNSSSGSLSFDAPVEVAYVELYSWWNSATAANLTLTMGENTGSFNSGNLVSGQVLGNDLVRVNFPNPYKNVNKASYRIKGLSSAASSSYYYFFNSKGVKVGTAHAQPENVHSVTGSIFFDPPVEIAYMTAVSWWNPAQADMLTLTTSEADSPPSQSEIRIYMRDLVGMLDRLGTVLSGKSLKDVNVTKEEAEKLLTNAVIEFRQTGTVQHLSIIDVNNAVDKVYNKVKADVTSFFDKTIAEESLNAISSAALAGGSIFSAFPLVSVIFDVAALSTMAAAMGLEIDLQVEGPKIMAEASGLKSLIDEEPQLLPAKVWNDARAETIETIGRLKGIEQTEGSSYLYALLFVIDQSKPNLTDAELAEELRTQCINFNDLLDKMPNLGRDLYDIVSSEDPSEIAEKVQKIIMVAPSGIVGILQTVIPFVAMTAILSFQTFRRFDKIQISWTGLAGGPVPQGMETRWRRTMTNIDRVQSAAGAIIGIFGATMSIWQAVKSAGAKEKALESLALNRDAVKHFYMEVIEHVR